MTDRSSVPRIGVRWLIMAVRPTLARRWFVYTYRYDAPLCRLATDAATNCIGRRVAGPFVNTTEPSRAIFYFSSTLIEQQNARTRDRDRSAVFPSSGFFTSMVDATNVQIWRKFIRPSFASRGNELMTAFDFDRSCVSPLSPSCAVSPPTESLRVLDEYFLNIFLFESVCNNYSLYFVVSFKLWSKRYHEFDKTAHFKSHVSTKE